MKIGNMKRKRKLELIDLRENPKWEETMGR